MVYKFTNKMNTNSDGDTNEDGRNYCGHKINNISNQQSYPRHEEF